MISLQPKNQKTRARIENITLQLLCTYIGDIAFLRPFNPSVRVSNPSVRVITLQRESTAARERARARVKARARARVKPGMINTDKIPMKYQ